MSKKEEMLEQSLRSITVKSGSKLKSLLPLVVYLEHLMLENGLADTPGLVEDVFDRVLLRLKSRYKSTTMNKKGGERD